MKNNAHHQSLEAWEDLVFRVWGCGVRDGGRSSGVFDMSELDRIVWIIEDDKIVESKIRDLGGFIEETTTPHGVGPKMHTRENELWTWGYMGQFPRLIKIFDTDAEAVEALEDYFASDFWNDHNFLAFHTREAAERTLIELKIT